MGFLVLNGSNESLVPMQRSGRKVQLAAISSNKVGKAIQVRAYWVFTAIMHSSSITCKLHAQCRWPLQLMP
jgi:hypothetical protein